MENYTVRGRQFRTASDYASGLRDNKKIEEIEKKINMRDAAEVSRLIDLISKGYYKFETLVGEDYQDELMELERKLRRSGEGIKTKETITGKRSSTNIKKARDRRKGNLKSGIDSFGKKTGKTEDIKTKLSDYDEDMQRIILQEMKKQERGRKIFLSFLALCIILSLGYVGFYYFLGEKNQTEYNELNTLVKKDSGVKIHLSEDPEAPPIMDKYSELYQKNRKLVGWLSVPGCDIDYPVMQTENNDYYLDHNYYQEYDKNGSIFMDKDCTPDFPNDNMIIYGHHMKNGKMFGKLNNYASEDFFKKNPTFTFDTIYEEGKYQVMYVFKSKIFNTNDIVFKYYQFIDAASPDEFYSNMENMEELQLYDTGVRANYGDKLVTLSTCDNTSDRDGRFVVVAKKIN